MTHQPHIRRDWRNLAIKMQMVRGFVWPLVFHRPGGGFEPAIQMFDGSVFVEPLPWRMSLRTASIWAQARARQAASTRGYDGGSMLKLPD